jgi:2-C-methyl-D-erythritol 4-phosphate cytidylyltransferase
MAAGQVLFQRFYFSKSFVKHSMEVRVVIFCHQSWSHSVTWVYSQIVAMACINLAAKIEEAPRRIRDVINVFHHIKQVRNGKYVLLALSLRSLVLSFFDVFQNHLSSSPGPELHQPEEPGYQV